MGSIPIPELELPISTQLLFFLNGIDKFRIGIEVCYKKLNPQINLAFNFLIKKYFFHNNLTCNINYSE